MSDITIRLAARPDIDALVEMRRDFTFEDPEANEDLSRAGFEADFAAFLEDAISSGRWHIWVAELDGRIVSHIFVALIDKVPQPVRENTKIAYLTNVYTRPEYRGRGIGAQLIKRAQQAARDERVELMIVWPSDETVEFYKREGFTDPDEPLIVRPRWAAQPVRRRARLHRSRLRLPAIRRRAAVLLPGDLAAY